MEKEGRLGAPSTSFSVLLSKFYQEGACSSSAWRWRRCSRSWQDEGVTKSNCDRAPTRWNSMDETKKELVRWAWLTSHIACDCHYAYR